jgi:hypothetical protein
MEMQVQQEENEAEEKKRIGLEDKRKRKLR